MYVCTPCTVVPHVCIPHVQYTFMYVYIDICSMYVCEASCTCHVCTDASYSCGTCTHTCDAVVANYYISDTVYILSILQYFIYLRPLLVLMSHLLHIIYMPLKRSD